MDNKSVLRRSRGDVARECIDLMSKHTLEYLTLLIAIFDICVCFCALTVGEPQIVSFFGASHISLGSLLSSFLLIVGVFEVEGKQLIPWICAQMFGTMETLLTVVCCSDCRMSITIAVILVEMAAIAVVLRLHNKFAANAVHGDSSLKKAEMRTSFCDLTVLLTKLF